MADIDYTSEVMSRSGLNPTYLTDSTTPALTTTDRFQVLNDGKTFLHVKNGSGGDITVNVVVPRTVDGLVVPDRTVTVPDGGEPFLGAYPVEFYNDAAGKLTFTLSSVTSVEVAAVRL